MKLKGLRIGVILLLATILNVSGGTAYAGANEGSLYLAVGDSLAEGAGASDPQQLGFVGQIHQAFRVRQHGPQRIAYLAQGGETSTTFLTQGQLAAARALIEDPHTKVQVVTLSIGGNNLLHLLNPGAPCADDPTGPTCEEAVAAGLTQFAQDFPQILEGLVDSLAAHPDDHQLLVMTYYNAFAGTGSVFEEAIDRALLGSDLVIDCAANQTEPTNIGLNDLVFCIGRAFGVTVVDVYPWFGANGFSFTHILQGDSHPTDDGHSVIASAFLAAVELP